MQQAMHHMWHLELDVVAAVAAALAQTAVDHIALTAATVQSNIIGRLCQKGLKTSYYILDI